MEARLRWWCEKGDTENDLETANVMSLNLMTRPYGLQTSSLMGGFIKMEVLLHTAPVYYWKNDQLRKRGREIRKNMESWEKEGD